MAERRYERVVISGTVQGVGFRPAVCRLALSMGVVGSVKNAGGQVILRAAAEESALERFLDEVRRIPGARVEAVAREELPPFVAEGFAIEESEDGAVAELALTPDLPVCPDCAAELFDPNNRRHWHPLISCAACGPRFTILQRTPYDRDNTALRDFAMCPACAAEYAARDDRRFHAQTISCHVCGPQTRYVRGGEEFWGAEAVRAAARDLENEGLVAVKGIGGYHLACLPSSETAVAELRRRKGREKKPFAVLFEDLEAVTRLYFADAAERALLASPARPIVLLDGQDPDFAPGVCAGSPQTGCFLAYTPLQHLLLRATGPLVMTSLNASGSPILTDEAAALAFPGLRGVLTHDRPILRPLDDSVTRVSRGAPRVLRRGRGLVPGAVPFPEAKPILALGGDLKAAFCIAAQGKAVLSAPFGDLDDAAVRVSYERELRETLRLLRVQPARVARDLHPGYFGTKLAPTLGAQVLPVQHHHAHIAAVMAEHRLTGRVIGAALDGTGYGPDGTVWGGEVLVCDERSFARFAHLPAVTMTGGDNAARDARIALDCYLHAAGLPVRNPLIPKALRTGVNTVTTTSAGRLFDAVSCFLGLCETNEYEGQCAVELERAAARALARGAEGTALTIERLWAELFAADKTDRDTLALAFHRALAEWIALRCKAAREKTGIARAALGGGVFQNELLLNFTAERLTADGFSVFYNRDFPSGDGALALGQAYIASIFEEG